MSPGSTSDTADGPGSNAALGTTDAQAPEVEGTLAPEEGRPSGRNNASWRLFAARGYESIRVYSGALGALIAICVFLTITQPFFLTKSNLFNLLTGNASLILVALGMTFVLLTAGFDLSVGAIMASAGYTSYLAIKHGLSPIPAIVLALVVGLILGGAINGLLIGWTRLNFLVVTLGTMSAFSGGLNVITNGTTHSINQPTGGLMYYIGNGKIFSVPFPVVLCLIALLICGYVLRFTSYGRAVYAVGGNREAARLAGINVTGVLISVYAVAGLLSAVAGVVEASRLAAASPTSGSTIALTAGAAALLGGTSFFGGIGGVTGSIIGALLIAVLQNGLGLIGVSAFWQGVVTGVVLVAAVGLDRLQSRRA